MFNKQCFDGVHCASSDWSNLSWQYEWKRCGDNLKPFTSSERKTVSTTIRKRVETHCANFDPLYCQQPKCGEFFTTADKCVEHTFCSITFLIGCSSENNNHYKSQACKVSWILCQIPFLSIDDNSRTPFAILESLGFICFKHLKHSAVSCTTNCHVLRTLVVSPTYRYFHQVFFRQLNITPA